MQYFYSGQVNTADITGSATFYDDSINRGSVRFAYFYDTASHEQGAIDRAIFFNNSFLDLKAASVIKYAEFNDTSEFRSSTDILVGSYAPGVVYFKGNSSNKGILWPDAATVAHVKVIFQDSSKSYGTLRGADSKAFLGVSENHGYVENVYFRDQSKNYASGTSLQNVVPNWMITRGLEEAEFRPTAVNAVFRGSTENLGNINGQITFRDNTSNRADTECSSSTGVVFRDNAFNGTIGVIRISDATFYDNSINYGIISSKSSSPTNSGHATLHDNSQNCGIVDGRASFYNFSKNATTNNGLYSGVVCRSAKFFDTSQNIGAVLRNAYFSDDSKNGGSIGWSAYFTTEINSFILHEQEDWSNRSNQAKHIYLNNTLANCVYNGEQYVNGTNLKHGYYGHSGVYDYYSDFKFSSGDWHIEFFVKYTDDTGELPCVTLEIERDTPIQGIIYFNPADNNRLRYVEGDIELYVTPTIPSPVDRYMYVRLGVCSGILEVGSFNADGTMYYNTTPVTGTYNITKLTFAAVTSISNLRIIKGQFLSRATLENVSPQSSPLTLEGTHTGTHSITGNVVAYDNVAIALSLTKFGYTASDSPWTNTPGGVGKYWGSTTTQPWSALEYWFTTSDCVSSAKCLPDKDTEVELLSGDIIVNLDTPFWVEPKNIKTNEYTITFTSNTSNTIACDISGNVAFEGSAGYGDKTGVHWRPLLGTSTANASSFYPWENIENWYLDNNTLNAASYTPASSNNVYLHNTLKPIINLDLESGKYLKPAKVIYTNANNTLIVNSTTSKGLSCTVVGNVIFRGNAHFG